MCGDDPNKTQIYVDDRTVPGAEKGHEHGDGPSGCEGIHELPSGGKQVPRKDT